MVEGVGKVAEGGTRNLVGSSASRRGIALNLLLVAAKLAAGIFAGSVSTVADGFNNLTDAAGSVITWAGFKMAGKKADKEHPFGHGRYEYLAGLGAAVLILLVGIELARSGVGEILRPSPLKLSPLPSQFSAPRSWSRLDGGVLRPPEPQDRFLGPEGSVL